MLLTVQYSKTHDEYALGALLERLGGFIDSEKFGALVGEYIIPWSCLPLEGYPPVAACQPVPESPHILSAWVI